MEEKEFDYFGHKIECSFKSLEWLSIKCQKCGYSNYYFEESKKNKFWEGVYDFEFIVFCGKCKEYICRHFGAQESIMY